MSDALEFFEERAAIFEFDANRSRTEAEILAMVLTRRYCESLDIALPSNERFKALSRIDACWDDRIGGVVTKDGHEIPAAFKRQGRGGADW